MGDAPHRSHVSAGGRAVRAASLVALLGMPPAGAAGATPVALDARVVWSGRDVAYVASSDSLAVQVGARLTFVSRGKPIAEGEVGSVLDRAIARVRITSGALPAAKHLARVRLLAEPPRTPRLLRVGCPSRARASEFLACARVEMVPPLPAGSYRVEDLGGTLRLTRPSLSGGPPAWPDTMLVRPFDDADDEEIALERGDVDVAVFWPGELSSRMREHPRWRVARAALRGHLACRPSGPGAAGDTAGAPPPDSLLHALSEAFRGDLAPYDSPRPTPAGTTRPAVRYEVDPSCPGAKTIERSVAARPGPGSRPGEETVIRLFYLEAPPAPLSSGGMDAGHATVLGAFVCPIVCDPALGYQVKEIGLSSLAGAWRCQDRDP